MPLTCPGSYPSRPSSRYREPSQKRLMARPHVLVLPMPYQGHVTPLMELSHRLVDHGVDVTFLNTEFNHALVLGALSSNGAGRSLDGIHLAAVPDGLADGEDRKDIGNPVDGLMRHLPGYLEELVRRLEAFEGRRISWLIADGGMAWAFEVGKKLGLRCACFWPASAAFLAVTLSVHRLIQEGVLDEKGWPRQEGTLQLASGMPPLDTSLLPWNNTCATEEEQPAIFQLITRNNRAIEDLAEVIVCNSFHEAEAGAFKLHPNVLPIGPLFADRQFQKPVGQFFPEDTRCLEWLDALPDRSVVYVAFGSFTIFDPRQIEELALGLELTGRPFLWVVRPDSTAGMSKEWLDEVRQRIAGTGMIVSWCSQQQVLARRAVACFVSHCGWNSTVEGVRNGVPFLCWPYFADQFLNQSYICNVWGNGLAMVPGPDGVVTKEEVRDKVMQVVGDGGISESVRVLKDASCRCLAEGGSSYVNFNRFVDLLKE